MKPAPDQTAALKVIPDSEWERKRVEAWSLAPYVAPQPKPEEVFRALEAERDLALRRLAVERGDESAAPEGWRWRLNRWLRDISGLPKRGDTAYVAVSVRTDGRWHATLYDRAKHERPEHFEPVPYALDALLAADLALAGGGSDAG